MSICLSPDEIASLTGKKRARAQVAELERLGVPFLVRRDGTPAVLRVAVDVAFKVQTNGQTPQNKRPPAGLCVPEKRRLLVRQEGQMA